MIKNPLRKYRSVSGAPSQVAGDERAPDWVEKALEHVMHDDGLHCRYRPLTNVLEIYQLPSMTLQWIIGPPDGQIPRGMREDSEEVQEEEPLTMFFDRER